MKPPETEGRPIFIEPSRYRYLTGAGSANGGLSWWIVICSGGHQSPDGEGVRVWEHIKDRSSGQEFVAIFGVAKVRIESINRMLRMDFENYRAALELPVKQLQMDLNTHQRRLF